MALADIGLCVAHVCFCPKADIGRSAARQAIAPKGNHHRKTAASKSHIGHLDKALDEAQAKGWSVVDMKNDWKTIFPFGNK